METVSTCAATVTGVASVSPGGGDRSFRSFVQANTDLKIVNGQLSPLSPLFGDTPSVAVSPYKGDFMINYYYYYAYTGALSCGDVSDYDLLKWITSRSIMGSRARSACGPSDSGDSRAQMGEKAI